MKVNGWTWDETRKRWVLLRGSTLITVRLPKSDPPENAAYLFGVQSA